MTTQVTFRYPAAIERRGLLSDVKLVAQAIRSAYRANASLTLFLPEAMGVPCIDSDFRAWAESLNRAVGGLQFLALAPGSELAREILLGLLPNLQAAEDRSGSVVVRFDALEAQRLLHEIYCSLEEQGVPEDVVVAAMTKLSLACGMNEQSWA